MWCVEYRLHPVWILRRLHTVPGHDYIGKMTACWKWCDLDLVDMIFTFRLMTIRSILLWWRAYRDQFLKEWFKRAGNAHSCTHKQRCKLCLTKLNFFSQKAKVFPPWASRLESVLQGRTLRESQVQTIKGELRQVQTFKHEPSTWTPLNDLLLSLFLQKYLLSHGTEHHQLFYLLERMLEYEPSTRISLSSALCHPFFLPLHHPGRNQTWRNSCDMSRWTWIGNWLYEDHTSVFASFSFSTSNQKKLIERRA